MTDKIRVLHAKYILPIIPVDTVFKNHCVVIKNGIIQEIVESSEGREKHPKAEHQSFTESILMPGLVNTHCHSAMTLLRGYADDYLLSDWLQKHIWPAEAKWVDYDFVYQGTTIAIAEMLKSGTTCFSDMYFFPNAVAKAALDTGMRAVLSFPVMDFSNQWAKSSEMHLEKGLIVYEDFKKHELLDFSLGPHAPYSVSDQTIFAVIEAAEKNDLEIQIHLHESEKEIIDSIAEYGVRPIKRLEDLGLLGPKLQTVHMTQIDQDDLAAIVRTGTKVIHCPSSNTKLASGVCPVQDFIDQGVTVGLGTDGAASNNMLDLFAELRLASLLAKIKSSDPRALSAHQALRMVTIEGAKTLGLEKSIGSLEKGKKADLIAVDLNKIENNPVYHPESSLVYTSSGTAVTDSWVNGEPLLSEGKLCALDETALLAIMREWSAKIKA